MLAPTRHTAMMSSTSVDWPEHRHKAFETCVRAELARRARSLVSTSHPYVWRLPRWRDLPGGHVPCVSIDSLRLHTPRTRSPRA